MSAAAGGDLRADERRRSSAGVTKTFSSRVLPAPVCSSATWMPRSVPAVPAPLMTKALFTVFSTAPLVRMSFSAPALVDAPAPLSLSEFTVRVRAAAELQVGGDADVVGGESGDGRGKRRSRYSASVFSTRMPLAP